jgi:hypothetical protein
MNAMSLRHGEVVVPRVGRSNDCRAVFDLERITQQRGTAGGSSAERPASVRNRGLNDIHGAPAPGVDESIPASSDTREAVSRCIGIVDEVGGVLRVTRPQRGGVTQVGGDRFTAACDERSRRDFRADRTDLPVRLSRVGAPDRTPGTGGTEDRLY